MSQVPLAPPPPSKDPIQDRWLYLLWKRISSSGQILWSYLDFTGSNLTDLATRNHADLQNINTASYTHLTSTQATDLTDSGDSTLHYHSADRDRANHTGTQAAATISDFDTEVSNNTDVAANTSARHAAVTVADTSSVDFTLTGQQVSAEVLPAGVDHAALGNLNSATYSHLTATQATDLTDGGETTLHSHPGGSGVPSNVISSNTTIAADTSYVVLGYLTVNAELTVNGNLGII